MVSVRPCGTGACVRVPRRWLGWVVTVRVQRRQFQRLATVCGNSAHIHVPKETIGAEAVVKGASHPKVLSFVNAIRPMFGKEIALAYIFGSFGTPQFRPGKSDIDVYMAVRSRVRAVEEKIYNIAADLDLKGPPPINPVIVEVGKMDRGWFDYEVASGIPLYRDKTLPDTVR